MAKQGRKKGRTILSSPNLNLSLDFRGICNLLNSIGIKFNMLIVSNTSLPPGTSSNTLNSLKVKYFQGISFWGDHSGDQLGSILWIYRYCMR